MKVRPTGKQQPPLGRPGAAPSHAPAAQAPPPPPPPLPRPSFPPSPPAPFHLEHRVLLQVEAHQRQRVLQPLQLRVKLRLRLKLWGEVEVEGQGFVMRNRSAIHTGFENFRFACQNADASRRGFVGRSGPKLCGGGVTLSKQRPPVQPASLLATVGRSSPPLAARPPAAAPRAEALAPSPSRHNPPLPPWTPPAARP
jgi:hypothetical protein